MGNITIATDIIGTVPGIIIKSIIAIENITDINIPIIIKDTIRMADSHSGCPFTNQILLFQLS